MSPTTYTSIADDNSQDESLTRIKYSPPITKILVAGTGAVGKTTLVRVLRIGVPLNNMKNGLQYHRTPFLNLETIKCSELGDTESNSVLLMVDVAGQLDFPVHALRDLCNIAIRGVNIVLLIFAADNFQSFMDLQDWISLMKTQFGEDPKTNPRFVILMNKSDLEMNINSDLVKKFMESEPFIEAYFRISCRTGQGLKELSDWLVMNTQPKNWRF